MRLVSVGIRGFRGYSEEISIALDDFSVLIGRNDAGKSTVFAALRLFLDAGKPEQSDYAVGGDGTIVISCSFDDLPASIVIDSSATTTLSDEHLLDEDGRLTIRKRWTSGRTTVDVSAMAKHPEVEGQEPLIGRKQAQLKQLATDLGIIDAVEDRRVNVSYRRAIWAEWDARGVSEERLIELPLSAEDGKEVAREIQTYFPIFQLFEADRAGAESDQLAQDPSKVIVKAVLDRYSAQLTELSTQITNEISEHLEKVVEKLSEFAPDLANELQPRDLEPGWSKAFGAVQFVDGAGVSLSKRGSGTRRLVLMSFFRAEAEALHAGDADTGRRGLILAVEEPETALHPDMQREALRTLMDVAGLPGRQVFITTHSTNLVRDVPVSAVRYLRRMGDGSRECTTAEVAGESAFLAALSTSMGTFSDHQVKVFLVVEGRNDIEGFIELSRGLVAGGSADVTDLAAAELQGKLCFIPIGGCGAASLWENRLAEFARPEHHVLDSDRLALGDALSPEKRNYVSKFTASPDGRVLVRVLDRRELENYLTPEAIIAQLQPHFGDGFGPSFSQRTAHEDWNYLDLPEVCAEVAYGLRAENSETPWADVDEKKRADKESRMKKHLAKAFSHGSVATALIASEPDLLVEMRAVSAKLA